jgi:hypothetical protein
LAIAAVLAPTAEPGVTDECSSPEYINCNPDWLPYAEVSDVDGAASLLLSP